MSGILNKLHLGHGNQQNHQNVVLPSQQQNILLPGQQQTVLLPGQQTVLPGQQNILLPGQQQNILLPGQQQNVVLGQQTVVTQTGLPINNNSIPFTSTSQGVYAQSTSTTTTTTVHKQTVVRPAIVEETVRTDILTEVVPVVHREVEQPIIHHIEKHITEAPAASLGGVVRMAPIIQETHLTRQINEVQPVIHKEVARTVVERQEQHLAERVVAPTQHTRNSTFETIAGAPVVAAPAVVVSQDAPTILPTISAPVQHSAITKAAIVDQTVRTDIITQVQPVVHREVEQPIIHHIEKHITEAPAPSLGGVVKMAPIIQETLHTRQIDEVQPVVHREVARAVVERQEQHISEHVAAPVQHTRGTTFETVAAAPVVAAPAVTVSNAAPTILPTINAPVQHSAVTKAAIVDQTVRTDVITEVQPVVHREVEQPIVHHIEKHITEAPAASLGGVVRLAPVVQENVNITEIDEVQPVVHREAARRVVERQEQHITENVVAPAQHTRETTFETIAAAPVVARPAVTVSNAAPTILPVIQTAAQTQQIVKGAIVDQTVRTDVITQVQPVIHREVEQPIVHHIEKHITEAPAPSLGGVHKLAPVIQETLHTREIDEVQPVVHREVARTVVERQEQHLAEKVVAPAQHTRGTTFETVASTAPVVAAPAVTVSSAAPTILPTINAPVVSQQVVKPTIVDQTVRTDVITQVQPVVHREVDQAIVHHIEKHITEAPAPSLGGVHKLAPVIQETLHTRQIDEVQPVVHREAAQVVRQRTEEHIAERVVAPTQHTNQVVFENRGVVAGAPLLAGSAGGIPTATVSGPDLNRNGIPDQLEGKPVVGNVNLAGRQGL